MKSLPREVKNLLTEMRFAYLCTVNAKSQPPQPHITPMFYVLRPDTLSLYLISSTYSKKVKNITNNPRVSLTIDRRDPVNPFNNNGIMIQGRARVLNPKRIGETAFMLKYGVILKDFERRYPDFEVAMKTIHEGNKPHPSEPEIHRRRWFVLLEVEMRKMVYWKGSVFLSLVLRSPS